MHSRRCWIALIAAGAICAAFAGDVAVRAAELSTPTEANAAPFGLKWGASPDTIKALGVELTEVKKDGDYGQSFEAKSLPKKISDAERVLLFFTAKSQLWRIAMLTKTIDADPSGFGVKTRYRELKEALAARYGKADETAITKQFYDGDSWVMGVESGRNYLVSSFKGTGVDVELSVRASGSSSAFCTLIYEKTEFAHELELEKKAREKDTL